MEKWQREHIIRQQPALIKEIKCDSMLRLTLMARGVLETSEMEKLVSCGDRSGNLEQVFMLLGILMTKLNGYETLANVLYQTKQTGALILLLQGYQERGINAPFHKCGISLDIQELLSSQVMFQGLSLPLRQLCSNFSEKDLEQLLRFSLNADTFKKLLSSSSSSSSSSLLELVEDSVPPQIPHYIKRSLSIQNRIDPKVFTGLQDDIFLIEDIESSELTQLAWGDSNSSARRNHTDVSSNQTAKVTSRFIHLEKEQHFSDIAKATRNPVHWMQFKDGNYFLVTSNKGSQNIQKYIKPDRTILTHEQFIESIIRPNAPAVFCISDSPGMGKSILLHEIARSVKIKYPERIVLLVNLSQFIAQCREKVLVYAKMKEILVSLASNNLLGQALVTKLMSSPSHKTELLFDGFDEILPKNVDPAKRVLQLILKESVCTRIYITTRPHMRDELQETLSIYAYNIQPFNPEEQAEFLVKYWKSSCCEDIVGNEKNLKEIALTCLSSLIVRDSERNITEIPMQCRLLADVYLDQVKDCLIKLSSQKEGKMQFTTHIRSIFDMYKKHMDNCFKYKTKEKERNSMIKYHMQLAMKLLFPQFVSQQTFQLPDNDTLFGVGLLETSLAEPYYHHHHPRFLHRTFAEYLAAQFLAQCIKNPDSFHENSSWMMAPNPVSLLLQTALQSLQYFKEIQGKRVKCYKFSNPTIAYFFNEHLKLENGPQRPGIYHPSHNLARSQFNVLVTFYEKVCCALRHDCYQIYSFLKQFFVNSTPIQQPRLSQLPWTHLIQIAAKYSDVTLFRDVCEFAEMLEGTRVENMRFQNSFLSVYPPTPLHISIRRGNYQIFEYLIGAYRQQLPALKCLLHACVADSYKEPDQIIREKIQIIKIILKLRRDCIEEKEPKKSLTPLLLYNVNFKLLEHLILEGANVYARNNQNDTVASIAGLYLKGEEYHNLIRLLIRHKGSGLFTSKNFVNRTPVWNMIQCLEMNVKTLQLLAREANVTFNNPDVNGDTELVYAIQMGRGKPFLECMILELGTDWKWKGKREETALHVACHHGNVDAASLLLSMGANPNDRDQHGYTPLHYVARLAERNGYQLAWQLLKKGADVNGKDDKRLITPLQYALERIPVDEPLVALIKEHGGMSSQHHN